MAKRSNKPVNSWASWPADLRRVFQEAADINDRTEAVARLLLEAIPRAEFAACMHECRSGAVLGISARNGHTPGSLTRPLQEALAKLDRIPDRNIEFTLRYSRSQFCCHAAQSQPVAGCQAWLIAGMPVTRTPSDLDLPSLHLACEMTALRLAVEILQEQSQSRLDELREDQEMLMVSDAMLGFVHEMNNSLNTIMLQASVMELKGDESSREDARLIRKTGAAIAGKLALFQQFRERCKLARAPADLNEIAAEAVAAFRDSVQIAVHLANGPLPVMVHRNGMRRLIDLLIRLAAPPETALRIATTRKRQTAALHFESRSSGASDFESPSDDAHSVEWLAIESLSRLCGTEVTKVAGPKGSLALMLEWPLAID